MLPLGNYGSMGRPGYPMIAYATLLVPGTREDGAMSDTGIVRRVDDLGRIVIPMELRRTLGIKVKDPISISVEGTRIILEKPRDSCVICGSQHEVGSIKGRPVCNACILEVKQSD